MNNTLTKLTNEDKVELIIEQERIIHEQDILIEELNKNELKQNEILEVNKRKDSSLRAIISFVLAIYNHLERDGSDISKETMTFLKASLSDLFNLSYNALEKVDTDMPEFYRKFSDAGNIILDKIEPALEDERLGIGYITLAEEHLEVIYQLVLKN